MSTQLKESQDQPVATDRPFTGHPVIARPTAWLRAQSMGSAIRMGLIGSVILTLCSYTVGATRERGDASLCLDWLATPADLRRPVVRRWKMKLRSSVARARGGCLAGSAGSPDLTEVLRR